MAENQSGVMAGIRRLLPYLKKYQRTLYLGLLCITLSNVCSSYIPRVVGGIIDTLKVRTIGSEELMWLLLQILALTIGSGFFMFATRRTIILVSRFIEEDLRNDFVRSTKNQSQSFYHSRSTGSLIAHFSNDISSIREFVGPAIMYTANTITTFAFVLSWMVSLNVTLTLAIVVPVPFIAWSTYTLGRKIHVKYKDVQQEYEHITTQSQESASGVRVMRAYAREKMESERFSNLSLNYYKKNLSLAKVNALMMPAMTVLFNISNIVVIALGGYLVMQNQLSIGDLTQFFVYLNQLLWPIAAIGWVTSMIQRGSASVVRLASIIDAEPSIKNDARTNPKATIPSGAISFKNVGITFADGNKVLKNISLDVPAGTSLGIVGAVGSGKSTLVNILPRLFDVTEGVVEIDGNPIPTLPLHTLREAIAMVPQEAFLFSDSIENNIRFGKTDATDEEVVTAARYAQLDGEILSLPGGYKTIVGERGITLSGGQKQRTSLARGIIGSPKILVLDDSLSAVDTDTEERILRGLKQIMQGRTTLIIAHRISTVQHCSNIIVLKDGEIAEAGTHAELIAHNGIYSQMYERQLLEDMIA